MQRIKIENYGREAYSKLFEAYREIIERGENPNDYYIASELEGEALDDAGMTLMKRLYLRKKWRCKGCNSSEYISSGVYGRSGATYASKRCIACNVSELEANL